jgi:nucleoside-diphosphate-sugar epimerase
MKIVVTGSEGSLMQSLIPKLLSEGHTIVGIDNLYRWGTKSESAGKNYEFHQQDLLDQEAVIRLTNDADVVIHAAAKIYGVLGLLHYRADILGDDTSVCRNVLLACRHNNISRIVYMSSSMVYDSCIQDMNVPLVETMTETCALPKTDYGLGKLVCERMVEAFHQQYGIDYTVWRPFNIVSPHEQSMKEIGFSHVLPDFVNHVMIKKMNPIPIIGNGEQVRCFTWIDDVSDIMLQHSFSDKSKNQIFNVCNVEPTSMKDAARMIYSLLGNDPAELQFQTSTDYVHDVKIRVPSVDKLQTILGPFDFVSTKESIRRCVQHIL